MFSHFDRIPACDGRTDGRTDRQIILPRHSKRTNEHAVHVFYAYASRGNNCVKRLTAVKMLKLLASRFARGLKTLMEELVSDER